MLNNLLQDLFLIEAAGLEVTPGLIKNVKIIGPKSKNGREYSWPCLKESASMYEGMEVYTDHPAKGEAGRKARDRFGKLVNVRHVPGDGNRGDLEYLETHPLAESILEDLRRGLSYFGLSHVADGQGRKVNGKTQVERLARVIEVDLVTKPATGALMEQVETMTEEEEPALLETVQGLQEQVKTLTEKVEALSAKPAPRYLKPKAQAVTEQVAEQTIPKDKGELRKWLRSAE